MNIFEMNERTDDTPVLGVSTSFVGTVLMNGNVAERMAEVMPLIQKHAYALGHAEAEGDATFMQLVPCVMAQAIPTRLIRVAGSFEPGYDSRIMSICAHDHIHDDGKSLPEAIDSIVRQQLDIAPEQVLDRVLVGISAPTEEPARGKHLLLMFAYQVIDFLERDEDYNDVALRWVPVDELMMRQSDAHLAPWSRLVAPDLLPVADATGRDLTFHFYMRDGVQEIDIQDNVQEGHAICAEK